MVDRFFGGIRVLKFFLCIFVLGSLLTYSPTDSGYLLEIFGQDAYANFFGHIGAFLSDVMFSYFGYGAYIFLFLFVLNFETLDSFLLKMSGLILIIYGTTLLLSGLNFTSTLPNGLGGLIGAEILSQIKFYFGDYGKYFISACCFTVAIAWMFGDVWNYFFNINLKLLKRIFKKKSAATKTLPIIKKEIAINKINNDDALLNEENFYDVFKKKNHSSMAFTKDSGQGKIADLLIQELNNFGITGQIMTYTVGPLVTLFEIELHPGTKASKITSLSGDLARALKVSSIRVVEVIHGKSYIGIEVPNPNPETVLLGDLLNSNEFKKNIDLYFPIGKDIVGNSFFVSLKDMPHLLIAGTTGSGKSVVINSILLGLMKNSSPEKLRFVLIDPKVLELSIYNSIPHLACPVITDVKSAKKGLLWAINEMEERYELLNKANVRNISAYNQKANITGTKLLPFIVLVIDELADILLASSNKLEEYIIRLAQKSRAAGIHLILATQRPSSDVITGLIKSNIPSRIALQVATKIDSRIILDQSGAESLLGKGDMLYLSPSLPSLIRLHGAYVSDDEVLSAVSIMKKHNKCNYLFGLDVEYCDTISNNSTDSMDIEDELYDAAVKLVIETKKTSISFLQRQLRIGFNRAARLVEIMEQQGVVGTNNKSGNKEVLVDDKF